MNAHWNDQQAHLYLDTADPVATQRALGAIYDGVHYQGVNANALRLGGSRVERFEPGSCAAGAGGIPAAGGIRLRPLRRGDQFVTISLPSDSQTPSEQDLPPETDDAPELQYSPGARRRRMQGQG